MPLRVASGARPLAWAMCVPDVPQVILFKQLYAKLVQVAGFSQSGREWIANGMCSAFISVVTYQVGIGTSPTPHRR